MSPTYYTSKYVLSIMNQWISTLPNTSNLRSLRFDFFRPACKIDLKLQIQSPGFELQVWDEDLQPKVEANLEQLQELIQILVEDRTTPGLGFEDVAVIADFLFAHRKT